MIRVFISSTFEDMQEERTELLQGVFPRLRREFSGRAVSIVAVDLRWGITREQSSRGDVVETCLSEIDNCRPFFVGMLGSRYGSRAHSIPSSTLERHPWLRDTVDRSVFELELRYGSLGLHAESSRPLLYVRHDETQAPDERNAHSGLPRLAELKEQVRKHAGYRGPEYERIEEFSQRVYSDLREQIREVLRDTENTGEEAGLDRHHEHFARVQAAQHVVRSSIEKALDEAVDAGQAAFLEGPAGIGKTSILAHWSLVQADRSPRVSVFHHFAGAGSMHEAALEIGLRLCEFLRTRHGLEGEVPSDMGSLRPALHDRFTRLPEEQTLVLVIDGLDQLDESSSSRELTWLPKLPANVQIVASARVGRVTDVMRARSWRPVPVPPLSEAERLTLLRQYLSSLGKRLDSAHEARLSAQHTTQNPLFLRTLLVELHMTGSWRKLEETLNSLLSAQSIEGLFGIVLERLEKRLDGDGDGPGLVATTLASLVSARRGLTEEELLEILPSRVQLDGIRYSVLMANLDGHLARPSGLLRPSHESLVDAVRRRYLNSVEARTTAHELLATYFSTQPLSARVVEELPHQQIEAGLLDEASRTLGSIPFLQASPKQPDRTRVELMQLWRRLAGTHSPADAYQTGLRDWEPTVAGDVLIAGLNDLASFFGDIGLHKEQVLQYERALEAAQKLYGKGTARTGVYVNNLGHAYLRRDRERSKKYFLEALEICKQEERQQAGVIGAILDNLGQLFHDEPAAFEYYEEALKVREKLFGPNHASTVRTIHNIGVAFGIQGRQKEAEPWARRAYRISLQTKGPNHYSTAASMENLALILVELRSFAEATRYLSSALRIFEESLGPGHPRTAQLKNNLAVALIRDRQIHLATPICTSILEEEQSRSPVEWTALATARHNLAVCRRWQRRFEDAESGSRRALVELAKADGNVGARILETQRLMFANQLGETLTAAGRVDEAVELLQDTLNRRLELLQQDNLQLARSRYALAMAFEAAGRLKESRELAESSARVQVDRLSEGDADRRETESLLRRLSGDEPAKSDNP